MTPGRRGARDATLLATIAAPLHPAQNPTYAATGPGPSGWYLTHADGQTEWLGRNYIWAEQKLRELVVNSPERPRPSTANDGQR